MLPIHSDHAYLERPLPQATLAEMQRSRLEELRLGPLGGELCRFLRAPLHEIVRVNNVIPVYDLPQLHRSLAACFPDWRIEREMGGATAQGLWFAENRRLQLGPGQYEDFLFAGSRFYRLPDGDRRVLLLEERYRPYVDDYGICVSLIGRLAQRASLLEELDTVLGHIDEHHLLRNQAVRPDGTIVEGMAPVALEDIALSEHTREVLLRNTAEFMRLRPQFRAYGVPQKRGVLLYGPPGTGKTMIGRALAGMGLGTFLYLTAANMFDSRGVKDVFRLARRLRPAIVFMEDLDLFGADRDHCGGSQLGELLAQMDGLEENDGLLIVATTNALEAIEPALKDRPSRFDVVLEIGLPEISQRRGILEKNLGCMPLAGNVLEQAAEATRGLSGAQVKEIAVLLMQQALLAQTEGEGPIVRQEFIDEVLAKLHGQKQSRVVAGFAAGTEQQVTRSARVGGQGEVQPGSLAGEVRTA